MTLTVIDEPVYSFPVTPRPSVPPPNLYEPWIQILERCSDGRWYLMKEYSSSNTAKAITSRERARTKGNWEFRHGATETGYGVWARNLDGPRVGEDKK